MNDYFTSEQREEIKKKLKEIIKLNKKLYKKHNFFTKNNQLTPAMQLGKLLHKMILEPEIKTKI